ncbi:MAG: adenylate/guanylate cyclase domain-containing protein [Gammaproteobacteria bacterium]
MAQDAKTFGIVFIDIARSTELYEQLGDQTAKTLVSRTLDLVRTYTESVQGRVVRIIGDEALCLFPTLDGCLYTVSEIAAAVRRHPVLSRHRVGLRTGLNFGQVILDEAFELYGDAVNVAARMRTLALEGQILLPSAVLRLLKGAALLPTRSLGQVYVKGKHDPVEIVELLWNTDATNLTVSAEVGRHHGPPVPTQIRFEQSGGQRIVRLAELPITIGRSDDNQIMVLHHEVSRRHAVIESQANMFVLRDQSTNGTQLQIHGHAPLMLHRSQTHLTGSGRIVLGRNPYPDGSNSLAFSCF